MDKNPKTTSKKLSDNAKKILQNHESILTKSLCFIKKSSLYRENFDSFSDYVNSLTADISDAKPLNALGNNIELIDNNPQIKLISFLDRIERVARLPNKSDYALVVECLTIYFEDPSLYREPFWRVCKDIGDRWDEEYITSYFKENCYWRFLYND